MSAKIEREAIRAALAKIAAKNGGRLTEDAILVAAKHADSVLHDIFEWDNKKAGHAWRIEQARELIRSVRVVTKTDRTTISTVCYVRDPDAAADEQGYVSVASLVGETERARAVLVAEFSRAAAALRRARELAIVFDMEGEVEAIAESIDVMRTRVEARTEQRRTM